MVAFTRRIPAIILALLVSASTGIALGFGEKCTGTDSCDAGACVSNNICLPCSPSSCESSLACSLNGLNTICIEEGRREPTRIRRRVVLDHVECANSCSCSMGSCNSDTDCSDELICTGGDENSDFSPDSDRVCDGICVPPTEHAQREAQEQILNTTTAIPSSNETMECLTGLCSSDIDCSDEEYCSGPNNATLCSGMCEPRVPIDMVPPTGNETCSAGNCTLSSDCPNALEECVGAIAGSPCSGSCIVFSDINGCLNNTCQVDEDCPAGVETCIGYNGGSCSGQCVVVPTDDEDNDDATSVCDNLTCSIDSDCPELDICFNATEFNSCSGFCIPGSGISAECPEVGQCSSSQDCQSMLEVCTRLQDSDICGRCLIPDIDESGDECPSETCRTDADCLGGSEVCDIDEIIGTNSTECSGRCIGSQNTTVLCNRPEDCQTGLETCEGVNIFTGTPGTCTDIPCPAMLTCGQDSDCYDGLELCQGFDGVNPCSGRCVHRSCATDTRTDSCSSQSDCPSGAYECAGFDGSTACSGTCALMLCSGDTCSASSECAPGQKCSGANQLEACSGTCQTVSLRFRNYRGISLPHFGKGFDFGSLFFSNRSIFFGRRPSDEPAEEQDLSSFLSPGITDGGN